MHLGHYTINARSYVQQEHRQVTVPQAVIDANIVEVGQPVFWGVFRRNDKAVYLTKHRFLFEANDHGTVLGDTVLQENHAVALPQELFTECAMSDPGETVHFVADSADAGTRICRLLSNTVWQELFDPAKGDHGHDEFAIQPDDLTVLGQASIQTSRNRITVPSELIAANVMELERDVFWGFDSTLDAHIISHSRDWLEALRIPAKGPTTLQKTRRLTVPKRYFEDFTGSRPFQPPHPPEERLAYGQPLVFAVPKQEMTQQTCYLFPAEHTLVTEQS